MNERRKVIGIDFGSTQSSIAIMEIGDDASPTLFTFEDSSVGEPMQTVLLLDSNSESLIAVGNKVKARADDKPDVECKFVSDFKRLLGCNDAESKAAQRYTELFLKELKDQIERQESQKLSSKRYATCIACPATWNDKQVDLLRNLVAKVGFPSDPTRGIYVLKEPVAALRAHLIDYVAKPENFLVMDFGGGTLDVCVIETDIGGQFPIVRGTAGDAMLGGRDFDLLLIRHLELVYKEKGLDYDSLSPSNKYQLDTQIRSVKRVVSDNFRGRKDGDSVLARVKWPGCGEVELSLSRGEFKNMIKEAHIEARIRKCIRAAIVDSGVSSDKITRAVLTGGSSLWFFVRDIVCEECKLLNDERSVVVSKTPFTDVAVGCALSKGRMEGLNGRSGLWVKWRFEGESDWHGPKELLKNGRKPPESPSISHQHLGRITQSRLLKPYRIELSFWEGEEGEMLTSYKEGKRRGGLESMAMVDFYARSNHPNLRWPMDVINMIRNRRDLIDLSFQDAYECFLHCKEYSNGSLDFKLEIRDWTDSRSGIAVFSWDAKTLIPVELGKLSRCGGFGTMPRKSVSLDGIAQTKSSSSGNPDVSPCRSFLKRIRIPKFHRKAKEGD